MNLTSSYYPNRCAHRKAIREEIEEREAELRRSPLDEAQQMGQREILAREYLRETVYNLKCLLKEI